MRRMLHDMRTMLRTNRSSILIFEIIYRIFAVIVLVETAGYGIDFALRQAGFSYLTARNALRFFFSPATLLVLAGLLVLVLFFVCLEMCSLYTAFQAGVAGEEMSPLKMLIFGVKNLADLFPTRNTRIIWINANFYLLTSGWIFLRVLKHTRPLNYIISQVSSVRGVKIIFWILLVVMAAVALAYIYAPSISVLRDVSFRESREKGSKIFRKSWLVTVSLLTAVNVFIFIFYYAVQFVMKIAATLLIVLFADKATELALVLTVSGYMDVAALFLASVLGVYLNLGVLTFLLYRYQNKKYQWEIPPYHYHLPEKIRRGATAVMVTLLTVSGAVYLYNSIYTGAAAARDIASEAKITSHRGSSFEAPENTIPAIEAAISNMSDFVEIDVQETKDGVVVLYHDASLNRITGSGGKIWEYTYGELLTMDFGSWFSEEFAGTRVATLEEALEICRGKISMNIELKDNLISETLVDAVLEQIELYGMEEQVVISSASYRYLKEVREKNPNIRTGYILGAAYGNYFEDDNIDFFSIRSGFITGSLVKSAHDSGKEVHAWTVNTEAELSRMKRLQVDNIITDLPVLAREVLYSEPDVETIFDFFRVALD